MPPASPPINPSLDDLAPIFLAPLEAWLAEARSQVEHVEFRVTETRRTEARQRWLYAQGREDPYRKSPVLTWTLDSRHRWGLAADLAMIRRDENGKPTGPAIWEISSWQWLYRVCPPQEWGLRHLGPTEWVHLELWLADAAIADAREIGLTRT